MYTSVESIFQNVNKGNAIITPLVQEPTYLDGIWIREENEIVFDDNITIDLCLWTNSGIALWDVSISKDQFEDKKGFLSYLNEKGFYLENIEEQNGTRWRYAGIIGDDTFFRIQYVRE